MTNGWNKRWPERMKGLSGVCDSLLWVLNANDTRRASIPMLAFLSPPLRSQSCSSVLLLPLRFSPYLSLCSLSACTHILLKPLARGYCVIHEEERNSVTMADYLTPQTSRGPTGSRPTHNLDEIPRPVSRSEKGEERKKQFVVIIDFQTAGTGSCVIHEANYWTGPVNHLRLVMTLLQIGPPGLTTGDRRPNRGYQMRPIRVPISASAHNSADTALFFLFSVLR